MSVEEWDPLPPGTGLFPKFECPDCAAAWWTAERLAEHRDRWHPPGDPAMSDRAVSVPASEDPR